MIDTLVIGTVISVVVGIVGFLLNRLINNNDKEVAELSKKVDNLEQKIHETQLVNERLAGKIDLVLQLLERVEERLGKIK